jgi:vesicle coat complex subunit
MKRRYKALDEKESEHICERVVPQLQHANGSVVLSAVKVRANFYGKGRDRFITTSKQSFLLGYHDSHEEYLCCSG